MIRVLVMTLPPLILLTMPVTISSQPAEMWFLWGCMAGLGLVAAGRLFFSSRSWFHRIITLLFVLLNGACLWGVVEAMIG
jgi:hypothetical protein